MKVQTFRAGLCAGVLASWAAFSAQAATVTFDDIAPNLLLPDDSFVSDGARFSLMASPAFGPNPGFGIVDTAASLSSFSNAPTGNLSQFYAGLNDNFVTMTSVGASVFSIDSFDYAYVPPVPLPGSDTPGALIALWTDVDGNSGFYGWDFRAAAATGSWAFLRAEWDRPDFASATPAEFLGSVLFLACTDYTLGCVWPNANLGQFAIDNIAYKLPLPGTLALAGLGLLGLSIARRRAAR